MKILKTEVVSHKDYTAVAKVTVDVYESTMEEITEVCLQVSEYLKKEWITEKNTDKDSIIETVCMVYPFDPDGKPLYIRDWNPNNEDT